MAAQTLQSSAVISNAVEQADKNLRNPLIDKRRVNVLNYYSAMTEYMTAVEANDNKLINTAQKNIRNILNGEKQSIEGDIYFSAAKEAVLEFLRQGVSKARDLFSVLKASDAEYRITANTGACKKCVEHEREGKLSEIDESMLPPYHPNCKCRVEIYDSDGNMVDMQNGNKWDIDKTNGNVVNSSYGMTLAPTTAFTANNGVSESDALNYWNRRTSADDFRDFFDKAVLKGINTNFVFRRGLAGINIVRIPFVDNHYNNNKNLKFDDYITDQLIGNATKAKMGFDFLGSNACGWVAVYNALASIDNYKHPADIIRYIENHNGLIADGVFGVDPSIYDELFNYYGLKSKTTFFNDKELDKIAQSGRTAILTYAYIGKDKDTGKASISKSGAHNISIIWNEATGKYDAYNPGKQEFSSIYDFINNTNNSERHFISLTIIY